MTAQALRTALELHHIPSRVRAVRNEPLPAGVETLLRIAAGETEPILQAVSDTGRSRETIIEAAGFFIEQILLGPEADSYRILAAEPEATAADLRRNLALILRWLHPDLDVTKDRSIFVTRVTAAWETLKSPERRAAYDQKLKANPRNPVTSRPAKGPRRSSRAGTSSTASSHGGNPNRVATFRSHPHRAPSLMRRLALFIGSFRRS